LKEPFKWDHYSDQPYPLKDKVYKKRMRKKELFSILKTFITSLLFLPFSLIMMPFVKRKQINSQDFFCLGVDVEREPSLSVELIEELQVKRVLIRIKLWDIESLNAIKKFILLLPNNKITLKILQDREHIENHTLLEKNIEKIFSTLENLVDIFEIGSTINRTKWGFFSVDEYSEFYKTIYTLKELRYPRITLIGSGVIDFEYHFTAHTLLNFYNYSYDGLSALLYVDRRGAPENTQLGFSLSDKIAWLSTMIWLSPKSKQVLHITETNWPISHTAPYAPTSELECVSEELYAEYMLRYYLLAFASQQVDSVSWHQLIAPGYGLVDNRDGITIRSAFETYKFMISTLRNAQFLRLDIKRDYYILQCLVDEQLLQIHWSLQPITLKYEEHFEVFTKEGIKVNNETLQIGFSPLYIYIKTTV